MGFVTVLGLQSFSFWYTFTGRPRYDICVCHCIEMVTVTDRFIVACMTKISQLLHQSSQGCSRTCHKIPDIVRLCNGSLKLVLTTFVDAQIHFWLAISYALCDWLHSYEKYQSIDLNLFACILYVLLYKAFLSHWYISKDRKGYVSLAGLLSFKLSCHWIEWQKSVAL